MNQIQKVKQAQYSTLTLEYLQLFALAQKAQTDVLLEVFCFYMQYAFLFENSENELNSCEVERGLLYATQRIIERPIKYTDPTGMFAADEDGQGGTVTSGDTLSQIVKDYNTKNGTNLDYNDVAKANGIENPDKIGVGQIIQLGEKKESSTSAKQDNNVSQQQNAGYSKLTNIMIGTGEILGGVGMWYLSYQSAKGVVVTGGIASAQAGWVALETFTVGSSFMAFGLERITGNNNTKIEDEITGVFEPIISTLAKTQKKEQ